MKVRPPSDYGSAAEEAIGAKRADYFVAGTLVVWDVDLNQYIVRSYRHDRPEESALFRSGEVADAEPALPDWRIAVNDVFDLRYEEVANAERSDGKQEG